MYVHRKGSLRQLYKGSVQVTFDLWEGTRDPYLSFMMIASDFLAIFLKSACFVDLGGGGGGELSVTRGVVCLLAATVGDL